MVIILWLFAIAGVLTAAYIKFLTLFPAYFKAFLAPEPVNSFEIYIPALFFELYSYPAIAISWVLHMQYKQILDYRLILLGQFRFIPLGTSGLL
jgi:hypothetical protein